LYPPLSTKNPKIIPNLQTKSGGMFNFKKKADHSDNEEEKIAFSSRYKVQSKLLKLKINKNEKEDKKKL
jgi:hypothetical protein